MDDRGMTEVRSPTIWRIRVTSPCSDTLTPCFSSFTQDKCQKEIVKLTSKPLFQSLILSRTQQSVRHGELTVSLRRCEGHKYEFSIREINFLRRKHLRPIQLYHSVFHFLIMNIIIRMKNYSFEVGTLHTEPGFSKIL